jgi:hypothetical protein
MITFSASIAAYEAALRKRFGPAFRGGDLDLKHERMKSDAFMFLRGTCWRWAEAAAELCPELMTGAAVGSVGDAHAGNFGLWRDAEGRLVWGVNDFDEADVLPYALDLVRLATSFLVADQRLGAHDVADPLVEAYRAALKQPQAFVLERENLWLRDALAAKDDAREAFWAELEAAAPETPPDGYEAALKAALGPVESLKIAPRVAGVGSLGRPRFVAFGSLRGGPVAREVKGRVPSCWRASGDLGLPSRLATGPWRSPDPHLSYGEALVHRRLAPNSRKIKLADLRERDAVPFVRAMAAELAAIHAGESAAVQAIHQDLHNRSGDWLAEAAKTVAAWTLEEYRAYRD